MSQLRCDRAEAWQALRAHYESKGRQFDLRSAFDLLAHQSGRPELRGADFVGLPRKMR